MRERNGWILLARKIKARTAEGRWSNPVWPSSLVTPAGTSTNLTSRINGMVTQAHTHTVSLVPPWEDQREWHRMTRMTGPDCAVMCNLINTHTHTHTYTHNVYVLIFSLTHNTSRRTAAGRLSSLPCTPCPPMPTYDRGVVLIQHSTARGLRSFRACTTTDFLHWHPSDPRPNVIN